ncbi:AraC family transcriptional regulator [Enterococcus rivorum]|uniref:AraC family transcriptional regulator n=1 Tax=Enterococcus rivorum TaxID=762845 RepID=A0A1E5KV28_9ENTE|nr:AraC family transcriptional regulator [Enterococcus rivorum]MBP2100366.1 AraC-like DNA-binding protein [Enterococcus rivorum]OEH81723.1 AraC family transcriptional regulator [Enterococcus rivorum]
MSLYLEIPEFEDELLFRTFINDGMTIVYPHWHKEIEIIYSKRGTVNIGVGDDIVCVSEGEIYFFASGEPHYFLASPDSERIVYQFDLQLFDEKLLRQSQDKSLAELFENGAKHSSEWPEALTRKVKELLLELYEELESDNLGKKFAIYAYLFQLVTQFYRQLPETKLTVKKGGRASTIRYKETLERLDKIFSYVEMYYLESISLEEVAREVGFSPYYFTRFFKNNTGQTFMSFLNEYRIIQAKFILANEKIPMIEVAEKSGFSSVKTFHHVFKESVGISPLKYQKSMSEIGK